MEDMKETEILFEAECVISGHPKVDVCLKNSSYFKPDIEGHIHRMDITIDFFCNFH